MSTCTYMSKHPVFRALIPFAVLAASHVAAAEPQAFGAADVAAFATPARAYHPETLLFFAGGNVAANGITADLEAIAAAGIGGIQLFHGQFGGPWPGVTPQIECLSPAWDGAINHVGRESRRLGLNFEMENCAGWAMSGGPWITPETAMRNLACSRTDVT